MLVKGLGSRPRRGSGERIVHGLSNDRGIIRGKPPDSDAPEAAKSAAASLNAATT